MTTITASFLSVLAAVLFSLTLIGGPDAVASDGPVIAWGGDAYGRTTVPDAINASGTATEIAADGYHDCAIQAGTGQVVC